MHSGMIHKDPDGGRGYFLTVFLLGLTSITAQIILLREFLSFFYGNELVLGLILANWMLLTGLGAYLGRNAEKRVHLLSSVLQLMIGLALLPFILVFLMYYLRNIVFVQGTMMNLLEIFVSSLVILTPFCLLSGFIFTLLSELTSRHHQSNLISRVYAWESTGSVAGGIVFNLVLIWFLKTFESLSLLIVLDLLLIIYIGWRYRAKRLMAPAGALIAGVVLMNVFINPGTLARKQLYEGQSLEYFKSSPYGNIVVAKQEDQINFYENQVLLFSSHQPILNEESVHYPLLQHPAPRSVLLLSGGTPGVIREILKYDIRRLDYVEINPWLLDAVGRYSDVYEKSRVNVINRDARLYVKNTPRLYDVVLIQLPEPSTVQLNRYYTAGFYRQLKNTLRDSGVIGFSIAGSTHYMSEEERQLNSSLYHTLKTAFENVIIVPGRKLYFVASDQPLTYNIARRVSQKGLDNSYVNPYYLEDDLLKRRGNLLMGDLVKGAEVNRDFEPITYYMKVREWLSYFDYNYWLPLVLAGFFILYFFIRLHPVNLGMFSAGFAGASIEVVLLVAFQILYGYVYSMVGVIVTVFMAGLAAGTYYREKIIPRVNLKSFYWLLYTMGGFSLLLPLILQAMHQWNVSPFILHAAFIILMFASAMLTGMVFSMASQLRLRRWITIASDIYSVDLLGAGIGTFVVSVYLIPLLGVMNVLVVVAGFCLLSGLLARLRLGRA
jgi:spermidine synthase